MSDRKQKRKNKVALGARRPAGPGVTQTLVCVFLRGGADTLNMIVPYGDDDYYRLRPTLSIAHPKGARGAVRLDDFYALHPGMRSLLPIYREGRLGIVTAVGSDNKTGSHFEAQDQMEHGEGVGSPLAGGWLGRHLRSHPTSGLSALSAVAIGSAIPESLRGAPAVNAMRSLEELQIRIPGADARVVSQALAKLYGSQTDMLGKRGGETLDLLKRVQSLRTQKYLPENGARYGEDEFSRGLREISLLIKADVGLKVACIDLDGWDTHFIQGATTGLQPLLINKLAQGLAAFDADTTSVRHRVTTLVLTEFGRRVYENASFGTDHGRGFAMMAMGNGIAGGQVHGAWPGLAESEEAGPGGLKVNIDYRSVLSEILGKVLGNGRLDQVFPGFRPQRVGLVA